MTPPDVGTEDPTPGRRMHRLLTSPVVRNAVGALALGGAGAYMIFGADKALGCLLVIVAVIVCRVLLVGSGDVTKRRKGS